MGPGGNERFNQQKSALPDTESHKHVHYSLEMIDGQQGLLIVHLSRGWSIPELRNAQGEVSFLSQSAGITDPRNLHSFIIFEKDAEKDTPSRASSAAQQMGKETDKAIVAEGYVIVCGAGFFLNNLVNLANLFSPEKKFFSVSTKKGRRGDRSSQKYTPDEVKNLIKPLIANLNFYPTAVRLAEETGLGEAILIDELRARI